MSTYISDDDHFPSEEDMRPWPDPPKPEFVLDAVLTFASQDGASVSIASADLITAFLICADWGLVSEPGQEWRDLVPAQLKLACADANGHLLTTLNPAPLPATLSGDIARLSGLREPDDGGICECCYAELFFLFTSPDRQELPVERVAIVTAMLALIEEELAPRLPPIFYQDMRLAREHICHTEHVLRAAGRGEPIDV